MKDFKDKTVSERLRNAAQAKQAMILRAGRPDANDPIAMQRRAERQAIVIAREARTEAKLRAAADLAERQASELAERAIQKKRETREMADREVASAAEQKALRDARYAARKKRKV
jgi:hypothetical protein